ncbi:MAG TPA: hypothetical protein VKM55_10420 [Candidatus Lokiarchaeia archaeon]|nr:hypothetical protein [Candidatus Lokiarchaeia archaeon]
MASIINTIITLFSPYTALLLVVIVAIIIASNAAMAVLAWHDAKLRGDRHWTFLVFVFFTGIVGVVIYLLRATKLLQSTTYIGVVLSRFCSGVAILLITALYCIFPVIAVSAGSVDLVDLWPSFFLGLFASTAILLFAWLGSANRIGQLCTFLGAALTVYATFDLLPDNAEGDIFPGFAVMRWTLFFVLVVLGFNGLFNFIGMFFTPTNSSKDRWFFVMKLQRKARQHYRAVIIGTSVFIALGIAATLAQLPSMYSETITISPRNYQAKFSFWGMLANTSYTPPQRATLNAHSATITTFDTPNIWDPTSRHYFVSQLKDWNASYPNVHFIFSISGFVRIHNTGNNLTDFTGGFVWDGSYEGTIMFAKDLIKVALAYNLTNCVGINTDQESPPSNLPSNISTSPNITRHDLSVQAYKAFGDWVHVNASRMTLTTTVSIEPFVDVVDGDFDLHYTRMWDVLDAPIWNEYAPMIYRCGYSGTKPYGGYARITAGVNVDGNVVIYDELKYLAAGLTKVFGNADRLGIYLGITNDTCYGRDIPQYDSHGHYVGKGYDQLVEDALIAKSFGSKTITIFILNTVVEGGYSMGGVFDTWGDSFLDNFNASVNGVNSTTSFVIYTQPRYNEFGDFNTDLIYNLAKPAGIAILSAFLAFDLVASICMHPSIKSRILKRFGHASRAEMQA